MISNLKNNKSFKKLHHFDDLIIDVKLHFEKKYTSRNWKLLLNVKI